MVTSSLARTPCNFQCSNVSFLLPSSYVFHLYKKWIVYLINNTPGTLTFNISSHLPTGTMQSYTVGLYFMIDINMACNLTGSSSMWRGNCCQLHDIMHVYSKNVGEGTTLQTIALMCWGCTPSLHMWWRGTNLEGWSLHPPPHVSTACVHSTMQFMKSS